MGTISEGRGFRYGKTASAEQGESDAIRRHLANLKPIEGKLIEDVVLTAFSANTIRHGLGRRLTGYIVVKRPFIEQSFLVYLSGNQTITTGASGEKLAHDTEVYDVGSGYDNVTNFRFTAAVAGLYSFTGAVRYTAMADASRVQTWIMKNGNTDLGIHELQTAGALASCSIVHTGPVRLAAGDYVEHWTYQNSGGDEDVITDSEASFFAGQMASLDITDAQSTNANPELTLVLRTNVTQTVSLWVF